MELSYWKWALETAQQWRARVGMPPDPLWSNVIRNLAPPAVRNGIYPAMEIPAENRPSSMTTFMYGVLPGRDIDKDVKCRSAVVRSAAFVPNWPHSFSHDYDPNVVEAPSAPSSPFP